MPLIGLSCLSSCTGEEPANAECDIEQCWVHFDNPREIFFHDYDTMYQVPSAQTDIQFLTRYNANVGIVPVSIVITPGASIVLLHDDATTTSLNNVGNNTFKINLNLAGDTIYRFRVTSEDGAWNRIYSLQIQHKEAPTISTDSLVVAGFTVSSIPVSGDGTVSSYTSLVSVNEDLAPLPLTVEGQVTGALMTLNMTMSIPQVGDVILNFEGQSSDQALYSGKLYGSVNGNPLVLTEQEFTVAASSETSKLDLNFPALSIAYSTVFRFSFDDYQLNSGNRYYEWNEHNASSGEWWSTGNPGFQLSVSSATPLQYPTVPSEGDGVDGGSCVKLTTSDTGGFGKMVNMRIAAGNLFVGTFDVANALKDALKATQMGLPFAHKPQLLKGYYKFRPGEIYQDKNGNPVANSQDICDIYVVVYRNIDSDGNKVQLFGDDILTSPHIAGLARIDHSQIDKSGSEWVPFSLEIQYNSEISREDVENELYNTAVVFSSSIQGAYFEGAIWSTLWIDNVTLECEY
ncbi:MAG: PCMD domain-containing protein [Bacteroidaceae bacterium]|nr:PCMD domain-containing protein [Bacteroidaceae bacterium]